MCAGGCPEQKWTNELKNLLKLTMKEKSCRLVHMKMLFSPYWAFNDSVQSHVFTAAICLRTSLSPVLFFRKWPKLRVTSCYSSVSSLPVLCCSLWAVMAAHIRHNMPPLKQPHDDFFWSKEIKYDSRRHISLLFLFSPLVKGEWCKLTAHLILQYIRSSLEATCRTQSKVNSWVSS